MSVSRVRILTVLWLVLVLSACSSSDDEPRGDTPRVMLATVEARPVTLTQRYVCRLRSHHHIEIRSPENGVIESVAVRSGEWVKADAVLFQVQPPPPSVKDQSNVGTAKPIPIKAPFDGLVSRLLHQVGELVPQGEPLTTLSDNTLIWAYFNVPEARYLEYHADGIDQRKGDFQVALVLANGEKFDQPGALSTVGGAFDSSTGNIAFRADFPNPKGLLRHGQTGTVLLSRDLKDAIVIPQRATFEVGRKRYVYVVDAEGIAHRKEVVVQDELEGQFVLRSGVQANDRIVVEGVREVEDGQTAQSHDAAPNKPRGNST